jgi:DNA-3-methyladenine glycosylase II
LLRIILEQQVSLASAKAAYNRLVARIGTPTPEALLALTDAELRADGFSGQKTRYGRELAKAVIEGRLPLRGLGRHSVERIHADLVQVVGIGNWTADIYLLMALRRPDIWPRGDLALVSAMQEVKRMRKPPTAEQMAEAAEAWRPWRAVGARILWHRYLSR